MIVRETTDNVPTFRRMPTRLEKAVHFERRTFKPMSLVPAVLLVFGLCLAARVVL